MSGTTSYGLLTPCKGLEQTNDQIQKKVLDRRKDEQNGQMLLHWTRLPQWVQFKSYEINTLQGRT